jgi:hypothetical protein
VNATKRHRQGSGTGDGLALPLRNGFTVAGVGVGLSRIGVQVDNGIGPQDAEPGEAYRGEDSALARGAPDDREFHLRRVCAGLPRVLSPRRLQLLALLLRDDDPPE